MALTPALLELFGSAYEIKEEGGQVFRHLACFHLTGKAKLPYRMSRTDGAMVRLKMTSKGLVTLKKEVLDHLGVEPGDYVDIDLLPRGRLHIQGSSKRGIEDFFGSLKIEHDLHFAIEEMNEAIEKG
ncbi:AbrB/MazE/SpoVT family DNA-binding domain-containing protein [Rhizobium sp. 2YAF20]|uniref:AbrB/MazE/SpoVT family DNA-binding domain-containing protein n=1 Tax=Rhizobium sp. 2YAF20 TaxID=3233027 RepID=UPI003F96FC38